jgi:hypothetical protein
VTVIRTIVATAVAAVAVSGLAGCGEERSSPPDASIQQPAGELGDIQRTLDDIDADLAGDDAP